MGRVVVVGSINQDITVRVDRFPGPGETLSSRSVSYRLGGKGANQAAAAAHGGAETLFVGVVGGDPPGIALAAELATHGVDTHHLDRRPEETTGVAFITVAGTGENTIVLDAGANAAVRSGALDGVEDLGPGDVVVLQGEVPAEVNAAAVRSAHRAGALVALNLAPVYDVAEEVLHGVDVLVVNETEAGLAVARPAPASPAEALETATALRERGPRAVLVTLGKQGAVWADGSRSAHVPAVDLGPVVDTTGAGDAVVGVLAAALAVGLPLSEAVAAGMRAGSVAVLAAGAAPSYTGIEPVVVLRGAGAMTALPSDVPTSARPVGERSRRVVVGADSAGFALKETVVGFLRGDGWEVEDLTPDPAHLPCSTMSASGSAPRSQSGITRRPSSSTAVVPGSILPPPRCRTCMPRSRSL